MEPFSAHVADVVFRSVWVMTELIVLIKQLLFLGGILAQLTLVDVGVVAVVLLVQNCHSHETQHPAAMAGIICNLKIMPICIPIYSTF